MLEKLPPAIGRTLRRVCPGLDRVVARRKTTGVPPSILPESPAFANHQDIPTLYTADGEGMSPPLTWVGVPDGARSLALIVEDADSPTHSPLVHAIVMHLPPVLMRLEAGAIADGDHAPLLGRNSFMKTGWLPPDPPPGHGTHRYAFQLFALDHYPERATHPGRTSFIRALHGHIMAYGVLVGNYSR